MIIKTKEVFRLSKILKLKAIYNHTLKPRTKKKLQKRIENIHNRYRKEVLNEHI